MNKYFKHVFKLKYRNIQQLSFAFICVIISNLTLTVPILRKKMGATQSLTNSNDVTNLLTNAITSSCISATNSAVQQNQLSITGCQFIDLQGFNQSNTTQMSSTSMNSVEAQQSSNTQMLQTIVDTASSQGVVLPHGKTISQVIDDVATSISTNMTSAAYSDLSNSIFQNNTLTPSCKATNPNSPTGIDLVDASQSNNASVISTAVSKNASVQAITTSITQNFQNSSSAKVKSEAGIIAIVIGIIVVVVAIAICFLTYETEKVAAQFLFYLAIAGVILAILAVIVGVIALIYYHEKQVDVGQQWLDAATCTGSAACPNMYVNVSSTITLPYVCQGYKCTGSGTNQSCTNGKCNTVKCTQTSDCTSAVGSGSTCYIQSSGTQGYCTTTTSTPAPTTPAAGTTPTSS